MDTFFTILSALVVGQPEVEEPELPSTPADYESGTGMYCVVA